MSGFDASGQPDQVKGWNTLNPSNLNNTGSGPNPLPTTPPVTSNPKATTPTATTQKVSILTAQDHAIFANHAQLTGDAILNIASRYATSDIAKNVNTAAGQKVMTQRIAHYRLRRSVRANAADNGKTPDQVRAQLTAARKAAGISCHTAKKANTTDGDNTEDESDADAEDVAAASTPTRLAPTVTIPANDQFLFNNSERLFGETLLTLAARYSNIEISKNIGKKSGNDVPILTQSAISLRITSALKARATATNATVDRARATLRQTREANNVNIRAANGTKNAKKVEPASQADVAITTAANALLEAVDTEMTDSDSGDEQQGYTPAEVDAANALLALSVPPTEEVVDAANTLMDIYRNDGAETEDEVSDIEMDNAEEAEFMADFQTRWRPGTGG